MATKRPTPKELVVKHRIDSSVNIEITVTSKDAQEWIEQDAPSFGRMIGNDPNYYFLVVSDAYNPGEVAKYLDSYNEGEE